jgi:GMP synthase (glutamine-hydrolysing)
MRVLVIEHETTCPTDRMGTWLSEAGATVEVCRPYAGEPVPSRVEQDALLVLGGHMGAYDDAGHNWLAPTKQLLAAAVDDGTPTLGVCLGAQLLAVACGGRVEVGEPGPEAGVVDVRWRPEAAGDRLVSRLPDRFPGPTMHHDAVVELPPGAVWLGETPMYPHQAFRVGDSAWGVQFHPEVSLPTFRTWAGMDAESLRHWGHEPDDVVAELAARDDEVAGAGRALTVAFVEAVRVPRSLPRTG